MKMELQPGSGVGLFNASSNPNRFVVLIAVDT